MTVILEKFLFHIHSHVLSGKLHGSIVRNYGITAVSNCVCDSTWTAAVQEV